MSVPPSSLNCPSSLPTTKFPYPVALSHHRTFPPVMPAQSVAWDQKRRLTLCHARSPFVIPALPLSCPLSLCHTRSPFVIPALPSSYPRRRVSRGRNRFLAFSLLSFCLSDKNRWQQAYFDLFDRLRETFCSLSG
jgi:hypothetical protein